MKFIPLSKAEKYAAVDDEDYEILSQLSWRYLQDPTGPEYATTVISMHRLIALLHDLTDIRQQQIDHWNGCGLDNRKINLRPCTPTQNAQNRGKRKGTRSRYKGVSWNQNNKKLSKPWRAKITLPDGTRLSLGLYATEEEAAEAYNQAAVQHHGQFARLNQIVRN